MPKLGELAEVTSKVAGPFELCFDIMFADVESYNRVKETGVISPRLFSDVFNVPEESCKFAFFDPAWAIKCTIPRTLTSGHVGDWDVFGAAQAPPLQNVDISL